MSKTGSQGRRFVAILAATLLCPLTLAARPADQLAAGMFLVAREGLPDSNFSRSVVLLVQYDSAGATGLIVNRPSEVLLKDTLPETGSRRHGDQAVYLGGPVGLGSMLFLFRADEELDGARHIFEDLFASGNLELLDRLAGSKRPFRAFAGYAGWAAGQLENEVSRGDWHIVRAAPSRVFTERPAGLWRALRPADEALVTGVISAPSGEIHPR